MKHFICGYCGTLNGKNFNGETKCSCNKLLKKYSKVCDEIAQEFVKRYYTYDDGSKQDYMWVDVGGVCNIGDEWWSLDDMINAIRYNYQEDKMLEYYYYRMENWEKESELIPNMKNYLKLN